MVLNTEGNYYDSFSYYQQRQQQNSCYLFFLSPQAVTVLRVASMICTRQHDGSEPFLLGECADSSRARHALTATIAGPQQQ
jgi:hypothetical protein